MQFANKENLEMHGDLPPSQQNPFYSNIIEQKSKNTFRLIFSHSPVKSSDYFMNLRHKYDYKKFFKTFHFQETSNTFYQKQEFAQNFGKATDSIVDLDDQNLLLVQYYRMDGIHAKRIAIIQDPFSEGPLKFQFKTGIPDLGAFQWYRIDRGIRTYVDVVTASKYLYASNTNDLKTFKKFDLNDRQTRMLQKQPSNTRQRFTDEDFRSPSQQIMTKDYFFFVSETSESLFCLTLDTFILVEVAKNVIAFDHYVDKVLYISSTGDPSWLAVVHMRKITEDYNLNRFRPCHCSVGLSKTLNKNLQLQDLYELESIKIKIRNWFTLITGYSEETGKNVFVGSSKTFPLRCGNIRIDFSHFLQIPSNNNTTPIKFIEFLHEKGSSNLFLLVENRQMHFVFFLHGSSQFGLIATNKSLTSDKDGEAYGVLKMRNDRVLIYGYYLMRAFDITLCEL